MAATSSPRKQGGNARNNGPELHANLEALLYEAQELLVQQKRVQENKPCQATTMDVAVQVGVKANKTRPVPLPKVTEKGAIVARTAAPIRVTKKRRQSTKKDKAMAPKRYSKAPNAMEPKGLGSTATPRDETWSDSMEYYSGEEYDERPGASTAAGTKIHSGQVKQEGETQVQCNGLGTHSEGRHVSTITNFGTQVGLVNCGCKKEATRATGLLQLHGLRSEPGSKIGPWGSGVLDLLAVDSLAPYNNWIAIRPRGSEEEETEAALYLRRPHPDPKPLVDAARDCEDNAREPQIGAERQGDKERKPESLQQGNDISPPRTALEVSDSNA
ncbi:hypothetical protein NDU88_006284 [Pleurodeles waltl]|uniref:Uncharacterized protein n=1 Tax=Pleurodeles waltl TaxID=8319 RepID=A0AAV7WX58_PLEWA|nr:hypothetical protein NDU88_006284 [Pleurodeles waltl]